MILPGKSHGQRSLVSYGVTYVCGVTQSRTWLKRFSSSSSNQHNMLILFQNPGPSLFIFTPHHFLTQGESCQLDIRLRKCFSLVVFSEQLCEQSWSIHSVFSQPLISGKLLRELKLPVINPCSERCKSKEWNTAHHNSDPKQAKITA